MTRHGDDELKAQITALLEGVDILKVERLPTSGNNRLYLVDAGKDRFVAKHYFAHVEDKRDRLNAEYLFVSFAFNNGIDCLPRPVACDKKNNIAVYSFVSGRKPDGSDVTGPAVTAALDFLVKLNQSRDKTGEALPDASEACFSIKAHIDLVEKRINRLWGIMDIRVGEFVKGELVPAWATIKKDMLFQAESKGIRVDEELSARDMIISPSDFGFHNSLIGDNGEFNFLDFEYAGWDDPAKTVGDFFSHLALPVPMENFGMFAKGVAGLTADPAKTLKRIGLLTRLYRIKWCCIALNHFLSMDSERRRFAGNDVDLGKEQQLVKARDVLGSMENLSGACHGLH